MGDTNTMIRFKVTSSQYIDQMPIVNGQVIILDDKSNMYYDINDQRFEVGQKRWELYEE